MLRPRHTGTGVARLRLVLISILLAPLLLACTDRSRGPATLQGTIEGAGPVGAAAFVLPIEGITRVEAARAEDWIFVRFVPEEGMVRVVLVAGPGATGPLPFVLHVQDGSAPIPRGTLMELADATNRRISGTSGYTVQIRP
jgi:hypothetical protein